MYDKYYVACKEIQDLHLMCMKLPPSHNKCKLVFDMWFKCSNIININILK